MKCSLCSLDGFTYNEVRAHRKTAHPPQPEPESNGATLETNLVIEACAVFDAADLDVATNVRVITYLLARYGTLAVE